MTAIEQIRESETNPRRSFDQAFLDELAASIRQVGIISPILVRPVKEVRGARFEIVAGHQRFRAAKLAELTEVPTIVRELTDDEVLELQLVENLQRKDIHPMDEAHGYHRLMKSGMRYDAARIAERLGRSPKYVYDRIKLLSLINPLQELFLADKITAGHAILLARLTPADQERVLGTPETDYTDGGLFTGERHLFRNDDEEQEPAVKPVSVRELEGWIDEHVRFDRSAPDPVLFPETAEALQAAAEAKRKVIPITYDYHLQEAARAEERTYGPQSWKRADGKEGSGTCTFSVVGVLVAGPGRSEAFDVCVNKKCQFHWEDEQRRSRTTSKASPGGAPARRPQWEIDAEKRAAERQVEDAKRARYWKCRRQILEALAAAIRKASAGPSGRLAGVLLSGGGNRSLGFDLIPPGRTAEDLVRALAMRRVSDDLNHEWNFLTRAPALCKTLDVDLKAILKEHAPESTPAAASEAKATKKTPAKKSSAAKPKKAAKRKPKK